MKATAIILGGIGHDQTGEIQRALRDVANTWSPSGLSDWKQREATKHRLINYQGPVAIIAHSYGVDMAAWLGEELELDLIVLIDPVRPGNIFAQPWAKLDAPKAGKVIVFERTAFTWFPPYTTAVKAANEYVRVDAGHNSICRDKGVIERIVAEVTKL
jgi:hypothetical protein